MLAYVTRFTFPDRSQIVEDMLDDSGATDFEDVLAGSELNWALPKSAMVGHAVWFQCTARSASTARSALRDAKREGADEIEAHIERLIPMIDACAGRVIAVGRVAGPPVMLGDQGRHFRGRVFAAVDQIAVLPNPVEAVNGAPLTQLAAFAPAGPVVNRLFADDTEYRSALDIITTTGNTIPKYAGASITGPIPVGDTAAWMKAIRAADIGFVSESQVEGFFAEPLLKEVVDGRRVVRQVPVRKGTKGTKKVDAVAWIGGTPVPIEYKLNAAVADKLSTQIASYAGPATLSCPKEVRTTHPYVLLIDGNEARLWKKDAPLAGGPALRRSEMSAARVKQFRQDLLDVLDAGR